MIISAAGYLRVSTDEQAEHGVSLPSQKSRIIAYCQSQGWNLYDLYIDDGYSGKNLNRPAMQRLIADVKEQKIGAVIVIKLDRLSRRQKDVLYLLEDVFEPSFVGFKSVSEPFDTTTPFGKAAIGMMAVFAQLERETIVERVREGKKEAAKQGRFMGGPIALGYKFNRDTRKLEINEMEAETVRFIFSEYLNSGKGYQHIADALNERHTPTPSTANQWSRGTIRAILRNAFYAGFVEHKGNMNKGEHPAIIQEEEFYTAQKIKAIRSSYTPNAESGLLTGIIYCGECGARMRMKKVWKNPRNPVEKVDYYTCYSQDRSSKSMIRDVNCKCGHKRASEIEMAVIKSLHEYKQDPIILKNTMDKLLKDTANEHITKSQTQAVRELDGIKKKLDKWYDAFEKEIISADDLVNRIKDLHEHRAYLEGKILEYDKIMKVNTSQVATAKEIFNILTNFDMIWDGATKEERRQIVLSFVHSVTIDKANNIFIKF
ncbi:recombinase family protein [Pelosinus sp. UFO1]|uniref:recombinase family protein n=1 Tax=Pelosinus sp. UFO1 TaxID=484770 RepID=UPI0004D180E4|nr:recombinase family protein [Pelosinus sp. UFO1]AIF51544.1 Resolvase domain-containing protein [Pelosinus sp. UFO1]